MINLDWVSDYIDIKTEDLKELAVKITNAGINIEHVIENDIPNLVIGKVISCIPHPNSDHMHICKVDVGNEVLQIVCGAPNVREGIKVIVAKVGCVLPKVTIKKSILRGEESNGMICALCEIGLESDTEENYNKGIYVCPDSFNVGISALKAMSLANTLYELDIHKHRNNDCYYHIGFAYEISAILKKPVILPSTSYKHNNLNTNDYIKLSVETTKCPYYTGRIATNLVIKDSPDFIKNRLISVGMRPINNVVDISNYVMLEYGQPLHFFDKDTLGDTILVRDAYDKELLTTLDKEERILSRDDIVITNGREPICLAGVMGGLNTEVTDNTKTIFIEAAIFDSISIRNTASRHNLKSEASIRYGKGLSYEYTNYALDRACHLLEKYASATIYDGTIKYDKIDKTPKVVEFTSNDINKILGIEILSKDMEVELNRLGFPYKIENDKFIVTIPSRRLDIEKYPNDIAEEIIRLYGYDALVSTLPKVTTKKGIYQLDVRYRKLISSYLRSVGLNETRTYTLVSPSMSGMFKYEDKENIILPNPMSIDKSVVRTTLIPSLINVYNYNKTRKVNDIFLYEISKTYDKNYQEESKIAILMSGKYIDNPSNKSIINTDFYLIKGIIEGLLDYLGFKNRYSFDVSSIENLHPYISAKIKLDKEFIGVVGEVHPNICKDKVYVCELSLEKLMKEVKPLKYKEISKYPAITKDVAFVVKKGISSKEIENVIKHTGGRLLTNVKVFDVYTGTNILDNEVSIAYKLTFQSLERTLTEEEVMEIFTNIIDSVKSKLNAKVRDN